VPFSDDLVAQIVTLVTDGTAEIRANAVIVCSLMVQHFASDRWATSEEEVDGARSAVCDVLLRLIFESEADLRCSFPVAVANHERGYFCKL
jgi:hypothetical protein